MKDRNPTILLVDNEPASVGLLSGYFHGTCYAVETVADAVLAWGVLEAEPDGFDLVILNDTVPDPAGRRLVGRIRQHPLLQGLPVVLQTAVADSYAAGETLPARWPERAKLLAAVAAALQDRGFYRRFEQDAEESGAVPALTHEATFTFRTIHSARDLAIMLANTCPEPQRAVVGLTELLLNAVEHGNLSISHEEKNRLRRENLWDEEVARRSVDPSNTDKEVWVEYVREPGCIRVRIRDQGDGFDWRSFLHMDPSRVTDLNGRGIAIARMISFDSIQYHGNGNEVEVEVGIPLR